EVEALDLVVVDAGHDRHAVVGDLQLDVLDAVLLAPGDLLLGDRPGGVGDLGLAVAEELEAVTGAGPVDGDLDALVLGQEGLRGQRRDRLDRRRAGDVDRAAALAAVDLGGLGAGVAVVVTAARGGD